MNLPFISTIFEGIVDIFKNRQEIKAKQQEREDTLEQVKFEAEVERIKRGDQIEADYDLKAQDNAQHSVIDEVMILWVLAVVTCLFIPALAPYAISGFAALAGVPVWFQTVFVGCFIAKLGLRFLFSGRTLFGKNVK